MSSDKTEQPTPHKLRELRREGQIPQRKNTLEAGNVIFSTIALVMTIQPLALVMLDIAGMVWDSASGTLDEELRNLIPAVEKLILFCLLLISSMALFSLLFGLFLNRFNFSTKPLKINIQQMNISSNIKKLFSIERLNILFNLFLYLTYLIIAIYVAVYKNLDDLIRASLCGTICILYFYLHIINMEISGLIILFMCIGVIDYAIQRGLFLRRNKMDKQEIKREHKNQEGDPHIKGTRRSIAINDATQPGPQQATHAVYSEQSLVAIIYDAGKGLRPFVVAKINGEGVARMCTFYRARGIPTVCLPSVARDFFCMARLGNYLPPGSASGMAKIIQELSLEDELQKNETNAAYGPEG